MTPEHKSDQVSEFFNLYAKSGSDARSLAAHYTFPCFIAHDRGEVVTMPMSGEQELVELLGRLLGMYKAIGVDSASVTNLISTHLSPLLSVNQVDWELRDSAGAKLYSYRAVYTLVKIDNTLKICSIAACEIPHYLECVARLKAARSAGEA